jgi:hypothetical protein
MFIALLLPINRRSDDLCPVGHCSCVTFDKQDGAVAVIGVTFVAAVAEPRLDFSQIAGSDWLIAQRTE